MPSTPARRPSSRTAAPPAPTATRPCRRRRVRPVLRTVLVALTAGALALTATVASTATAGATGTGTARADHREVGDRTPRVRVVDLGVHESLPTEAWHIADSGTVFGVTVIPMSGWEERRAFRWERGTVTELGGPTQGSVVHAANVRGDAAGQIFSLTGEGRTQAVVWRRDGTVLHLGTEGLPSVAQDINRRGTAVGWAGVATGDSHAVIWRHGRTTVIDHEDAGSSFATAINDRGQVVGYRAREGNGDPYHPFRHHRGTTTIFQPPVELDITLATDINRRGHVLVVTADKFGPGSIWYLWDGERTTRLPGSVRSARFTDRGDVIATTGEPGAARTEAAVVRAGVVIPLGTLGGSSAATAGNRRGEVVGWADHPTGGRHAVLYERGGVVDLGTLGGASSEALDIDRRGRIVGWAEDADGVRHAVLWKVRR